MHMDTKNGGCNSKTEISGPMEHPKVRDPIQNRYAYIKVCVVCIGL